MNLRSIRPQSWPQIQRAILSIGCVSLLAAGPGAVLAQEMLPPDQLDALVAPIALYPDDLLAQTLVAATYPLEIIQLQQWLSKNPDLKDEALADAVAQQPWDAAIQSMAPVPEVVERLANDVQWTTGLGNAFLAQQGDVMDAVQRMRAKAQGNGALESNEQQKVETTVVETDTVIVVQSASPEVIYVPYYVPTVVYGPPVYPYPPIYYPPYPPGAPFVSFSVGVMVGAAIWGGSCCHSGWGNNTVIINRNNNFNRINNPGGGNGNWQHSPEHRGAAPYGDKATASRYGGSARGQSPSTQSRAGTSSARPSTTQARPSTGGSDRAASGSGSRSGGDQIGSRDIPKSSGSKPSAMTGGSSGFSGSSARASSSRGASSMRSSARGGRRR